MRDLQAKRQNLAEAVKEKERVGLGVEGHFDTEIYDIRQNKYAGYVTSIAASDEIDAVSCDTFVALNLLGKPDFMLFLSLSLYIYDLLIFFCRMMQLKLLMFLAEKPSIQLRSMFSMICQERKRYAYD